MSAKKTIEHYDLHIPVSEVVRPSIDSAVGEFADSFDYPVLPIKFKGDVMMINSMDLVHLLGYWQAEELPDLVRRRFLQELHKQLDMLLTKSVHPDYRYHYQWCLTAIKSLPTGRHA